MKTRTLTLACILVLGLSCSKNKDGRDADADPANDALWYHEPIGDDADPAFHKGVGIDK